MANEAKLNTIEAVLQFTSWVQLLLVSCRMKLGTIKTVCTKNWNPLSTADSTIFDKLTIVL